jgi:lipoate-protein ligase A
MADPYHADHNQGQWHFLPFLAADVRTQMAMDTELAEYCERGGDTAFVRLYRMDPPGITIGRNQRWRSVIDEKQCALEGWDWMRRPTGGGALLHRAEINYAVVAPRVLLDPKESASFRPAFERILAALSAVIRNLGFTPTV